MKYLLYCRKSTDTEDKQVLSLESQEKELLDLAAAKGLDVVRTLQESRSAKSEGRPIFAEVLSLIQRKEADAILCWKLDRLARNMVDAGRVMDLLQRGVIQEIRTHDAIHLPSDNVLMLAVQLGMANQYIRDLSENVKRGNRAKLERGEWPNHAPFGYQNNPATKTLLLDPPRSQAVIRMFQLFASGQYSMQEVVDRINAEGFRAASGGTFMKSRVEKTIKNPFYFGLMLRNGKYYAGKHEPLISKTLFDQAQSVLEGVSRPKEQRLLFPLRGLLVCASCTCMYTASLKKGHEYYYCTNGKKICEAHTRYLRSEPATELVADALDGIRFDPEMIEMMYEASREKYAQKFAYTDTIQKRLQSQLETLEKQEIAAFEDSSIGILRRDLYERKMGDIKNKRVLLQHELNSIRTEDGRVTLEPIGEAYEKANTARNRFLAATPERQRIVASEVLWNLSVLDGKTKEIKYRSYFEIMAKSPKSGDLEKMLADLDSNLMSAWNDVRNIFQNVRREGFEPS
jgi:site-specific DNA recombinase